MDKASDTKALNDPQVRRSVTGSPPARPTDIDKVRVIKRSLLCYNISWLGLIPLLGIAPALIALRLHLRIRDELHGEWNPARRYDLIGLTVAVGGLAVSGVLWMFVFCNAWRTL